MLVSRLQKERDEIKSECKELHDKLELQQAQHQKLTREKEILNTELDVYKERLEKLQSSVQKIHVISKKQKKQTKLIIGKNLIFFILNLSISFFNYKL